MTDREPLKKLGDYDVIGEFLKTTKHVKKIGVCDKTGCGGNVYQIGKHISCSRCSLEAAERNFEATIERNIKNAEKIRERRLNDEAERQKKQYKF